MPASDDDEQRPKSKIVRSRKELQFLAAAKLAAMDPKIRELLLRLERARRGLPVTRNGGPIPGLPDLIAAIPDDQVAEVARHAGITVSGLAPSDLRSALLLLHKDQVLAALTAAAVWRKPYPRPEPEGLRLGGRPGLRTYSPSPPYRLQATAPVDPAADPPTDEPTDPVTAYRLGAQLLLELMRPGDEEPEELGPS